MGIMKNQPDDGARTKMRADYADNADSLIASSQVIAIHYHTIAKANNY